MSDSCDTTLHKPSHTCLTVHASIDGHLQCSVHDHPLLAQHHQSMLAQSINGYSNKGSIDSAVRSIMA